MCLRCGEVIPPIRVYCEDCEHQLKLSGAQRLEQDELDLSYLPKEKIKRLEEAFKNADLS